MFAEFPATLVTPALAGLLLISLVALVLVGRFARQCRSDNRRLHAEHEAAALTIADLRLMLDQVTQQAATLQDSLHQTKQSYDRTVESLKQDLARAHSVNRDLTEQRALLHAELAHRYVEWDALRSELDSVTSEVGQRENRILDLEALLEQNTDAVADLNQVNSRDEDELERLKRELVRTEASLDQLRDELRQRSQTQTHLERKLQSFRKSFRAVAARH